jgi:hypothetical protein
VMRLPPRHLARQGEVRRSGPGSGNAVYRSVHPTSRVCGAALQYWWTRPA